MIAKKRNRNLPWYLIFIFLISALGIVTTGFFYFKNQESYIENEKQQELAAIIALKTAQIRSWRQERIAYANAIMDDPFLAVGVSQFITGRADPLLKRELLTRLTALASYQNQGLELIDPQGNVKLAIPQTTKLALPPYLQTLAGQAMQTKKVVFSDLYLDEDSKAMLSVLIPLLAVKGTEEMAVGVILLRIEPYQFLYPLIKWWPTPSLTAETVLVGREGDEVVYLSELRHRKNIPLSLRFPVNTPNLVSAQTVRGMKGLVRGVDYRGVPVLAAVGAIPDSPWRLIAKIDADEVYVPVKKRFRELIFLLASLIASAGICVAYFWRNQQTVFYRRQYEAERARRVLAQRYEYLTRFANDIILVTDEKLKIVEANNKAVASYGYDRGELLKMHLIDLFPPGSKQILMTLLLHEEDQSGTIFEAQQRRKDGSTFPAEISLRLLQVEGEKLFQEIIRDITERKQNEEALQESAKNLRILASQLLRAQEDERKRISRELHDELGHALLTLKLQMEAVGEQLLPRQASLKKEMKKILGFMDSSIEGVRRLYHDLSPGDLEDLGLTTALRSLVEDFAELQKHITWTVKMDPLDGLFAMPAQTVIYRVVQEALTNIGKHAKPHHVSLEIRRNDHAVSFVIEDDGAGFERRKIALEKKTVGLLAMEERVKILGGTFELWSQENRGTRITISIPIPEGI